jgi:RNA:NAD 2'-phosphotransferase (TPT1/KptA family)
MKVEAPYGLATDQDQQVSLSDNGVWLTDHVPAQYIDSDGSGFHGN